MKRVLKSIYFYLAITLCVLAIIGGKYFLSKTQGNQTNDRISLQIEEYLSQASTNISVDLKKADDYFQKAKEIVEVNEVQGYDGALYKIEGRMSLEKAEYSEALGSFISAENIYRNKSKLSNTEKSEYANILNYIGQVYFLIDRNEMALEYLNQSINIYDSLNDSINISRSYRNLGSIYFKQGEFEKALEAYEYSLDSDFLNLKDDDLAILYSNLAAVNFSLNKVEESKKYLDKAEIEIQKLIDEDNKNVKFIKLLSKTRFNKAVYFNEVGSRDLYIIHLEEAVNILNEIYAPAELYPPLQKLQTIYESENNIEKAYENLIRIQEIKENLFNIENARQISNLEIQQKLFEEQQHHEMQKREMERKYWMVLAGLLFVLLAFLIFLNVQKNKIINAEKEKQLLAKTKQLLESKIYDQEEILNKKENKVQNLALEIEEKERDILNLEAHIDQINSTLRKHINSRKVSNLLTSQSSSENKEKEREKLLN